MSVPLSVKLNEDPCPITDQLLGQLRQAAPPDASEIAKSLPDQQRARLATFCYNRRHLHVLGMVIASTCERQALVEAAGNTGDLIFEQSRNHKDALMADMRPPGSGRSKPISLAGPCSD